MNSCADVHIAFQVPDEPETGRAQGALESGEGRLGASGRTG